MKEIYIHVGLPKTGTTFLQEEIFKKMKVRYIRGVDFRKYCFHRDKKTIISEETLSGDPYSKVDNRYIIAENLHKLFPDAKIIVGLRNPKDLIESLKSQYIRGGGVFKTLYINPSYVYGQKEYVNYLKSLFSDVFVYDYDKDIKRDKKSFVERLCEFVGEPVPDYKDVKYRVRLKPYQMRMLEFINRFFYYPERNPYGKLPTSFGEGIREVIGRLTKSGMQRL